MFTYFRLFPDEHKLLEQGAEKKFTDFYRILPLPLKFAPHSFILEIAIEVNREPRQPREREG
ncbi:MAG: hypothetical protein WCS94_16320 [Verrucomicrobiota bacterium]